jgi:hypothetical protein
MPVLPAVPRDPDADLLTRRAIQVIGDALNAIIRRGELVQTGNKSWTIRPSVENAGTILAARVFNPQIHVAGLPQIDPNAVMAAHLFAPNVFYGQLG